MNRDSEKRELYNDHRKIISERENKNFRTYTIRNIDKDDGWLISNIQTVRTKELVLRDKLVFCYAA